MNKRVVFFSLLIIAIFFIFRYCSSKPEPVAVEQKPVPLSVSKNSAFNQSYGQLLSAYYSLKDAFASGDESKANSAATQLAQLADSLNADEIQGDSSIRETAEYFATTIAGSARSIPSASAMSSKLSSFNMITDALWSLTRTVRYDGQKVYYHFCSKALDNSGGYWLSPQIDNNNPYGLKEPCSGVTDSLDYSKK